MATRSLVRLIGVCGLSLALTWGLVADTMNITQMSGTFGPMTLSSNGSQLTLHFNESIGSVLQINNTNVAGPLPSFSLPVMTLNRYPNVGQLGGLGYHNFVPNGSFPQGLTVGFSNGNGVFNLTMNAAGFAAGQLTPDQLNAIGTGLLTYDQLPPRQLDLLGLMKLDGSSDPIISGSTTGTLSVSLMALPGQDFQALLLSDVGGSMEVTAAFNLIGNWELIMAPNEDDNPNPNPDSNPNPDNDPTNDTDPDVANGDDGSGRGGSGGDDDGGQPGGGLPGSGPGGDLPPGDGGGTTTTIPEVPEPATMLLWGGIVVAGGIMAQRRRRR